MLKNRITISEEDFLKSAREVYTIIPAGKGFNAICPSPLFALNQSFDSEFKAWAWLAEVRNSQKAYEAWEILDATKAARCLWSAFFDIQQSENQKGSPLKIDFLHFNVGDEVADVWGWFERSFSLKIEELINQSC
jgi:hypothetical protein